MGVWGVGEGERETETETEKKASTRIWLVSFFKNRHVEIRDINLNEREGEKSKPRRKWGSERKKTNKENRQNKTKTNQKQENLNWFFSNKLNAIYQVGN